MKPSMRIGNRAELTITVTDDMCPSWDGVVVHPVYSTWSMGHHFELAARKVLKDHLEDDEEGIGSHLSIDHLAPTPLGHQVRVVAEVTDLDDTTVVCELVAYHVRGEGEDRIVGRGRQVQRILPKSKLASLIKRASR
jgi:fluoroacetyl-CoA thioesterase